MTARSVCALCLAVFVLTDKVSTSDVVDFASSLIGRPYVWGAEGPAAFDCSGLTQYVFGEFGIELPRRAIHQSAAGNSTGRSLQRGDLVFFASDSRRSLVTHVGIYEGRGMMVNASKRHGRVRRDDLNEEFWATRFLFARRIVKAHGPISRREDDREPVRRTERRGDARREAARVLGRIADALLRRPPH